jgi:hypothetical protein
MMRAFAGAELVARRHGCARIPTRGFAFTYLLKCRNDVSWRIGKLGDDAVSVRDELLPSLVTWRAK